MNVLVDVDVLVAAHRAEHPAHDRALMLIDGGARDGFGLCAHVINGFLRLVTHPQVFPRPTPLDLALATVAGWRSRPRSELLPDTDDSWAIFTRLCRQHAASGNAVYDLHLAALAMAHGRVLLSSDQGFGRIVGLHWQCP